MPSGFLHIALQRLPLVGAAGGGLGGLWDPCAQAIPDPVSWCHRRLTDRQRALMMSYAEDETDVDGTVNGVTNTASGE